MIPALAFVLVVAHFIADFVCQSDWMAINKSKRWDALAWHVLVYSVVVGAIIGSLQLIVARPFLLWWGVNTVAHFVQDAITSRWTTRLWFIGLYPRPPEERLKTYGAYSHFADIRSTRHAFFVVIGLDQCLHYVVLFGTANWWLK